MTDHDLIRKAVMFSLGVTGERGYTHDDYDAAMAALDALVARANRLEKAMREQTRYHSICRCSLCSALAGVPAEPATEWKRIAEARQAASGYAENWTGPVPSSVSAGAGQVPADTIAKALAEMIETAAVLNEALRRAVSENLLSVQAEGRIERARAALAALDAQEPKP